MNTKPPVRLSLIAFIMLVAVTHIRAAGEAAPVFYGATTAQGVVGADFSYQAEASFYGLTADRVDWTTAEDIAVALGGHLVTINSGPEQETLERIFMNGTDDRTPYWIGLNDEEVPNTFVWSSAEPVTYTKWKSGEPNNYSGNEKYVVANWKHARNAGFPKGTWNDAPLNGTSGFGGVSDGPYRGIMELPLPADARFFATNLPASLAINPLTGLITGTPTLLGTYTVTLSLVSGSGVITQDASFTFARGPDDSLCSNCPPIIITQPFSRTNVVGATVSFDGTASGNAPLAYQWRKDGVNIPGATNATFALTNVQLTDAGAYLVNVSNAFGSVSSAQKLTVIIPPCSNCPPVRYVNGHSANPIAPYTNWATAATRIQDAIDSAAAGDEIIVTNGVYAVGGLTVNGIPTLNRVTLFKPVIVRSVNGPEATAIDGGGSVRCAYVGQGAMLSGFTLINGNATGDGTSFGKNYGGGIWCATNNAVVSNCVLFGNSAYEGGGAYRGTLNNCLLADNLAQWDGSGGGALESTLNHCTLTENFAYHGGGAFRCTLNNCTLTYNSADSYGGGAAYGTLNNCVVMGNWASASDWDDEAWGGGAAFSTLNNCTVTGNSADFGGGVLDGTLNNCIVYYNGGGNHAADGLQIEPLILNYCATIPMPFNGTGNITNEPVFLDLDCGNLRLAWNSPCVNAGNNAHVPNGSDLDGHARIVGAAVDLGAYELQEPYIVGAIVTEGNTGTTHAAFSVRLATNHSEIVSVDFTTVAGSATAGSDYLATNGTLLFNPGETNKTITVLVPGDIIDEADETFFVRLSNPTNISLINTQAVGTILDDDRMPLSIAGVMLPEGNIGTSDAVFMLRLDNPHVLPVSVDFVTAEGTAAAGADYIATSGTVTFAPGETNKGITIFVYGDVVDEADKTFFVNLSNPLHAVLTSTQAAGTILDDDMVPLSIAGVTMREGNIGTSDAIFTLQLARAHVLPVSIDFTTVDGSAAAGGDYTATNGTIILGPGETNKNITVLVRGDSTRENDELFLMKLSHPVHASLVNDQAIGTILNDDTAQLRVNASNLNPAPPHTNWATAAATIQDAVDASVDGDEIVVTNGVYVVGGRAVNEATTNRVAVTKRLIVRSVNGPEATTIFGGGIRCVYLANAATLVGFTLNNGSANIGGGVKCESTGAVLSNCFLISNSASIFGGGAYSGTLLNCRLTSNSVQPRGSFGGGGAYGSVLNNCVLTDNVHDENCGDDVCGAGGGGANNCVLNGCLLTNNSASYYGGGAIWSELNNCTLTGNWSGEGGGAAGSRLNNCKLTGNHGYYGAGAAESTLNNCVLVGNNAQGYGGGAYFGTMNNCTIAGNSAGYIGGGAADAVLNNCIVYYNTVTGGFPPLGIVPNNCVGGTVGNCCTTPLSGGTGNITNEPLFIDLLSGNVRVAPNSPCINAGNNAFALLGTDLDGNPRIVGSAVDMGAYEFQTLFLSITRGGGNGSFIRGSGVTGITYQWQRATNVAGPWTSNATVTALAPGIIEFRDTNAPPSQAFYRAVRQ